jgi:hypothetical protein
MAFCRDVRNEVPVRGAAGVAFFDCGGVRK